ncbi:MAG: FtsW/RodA/SpoVE family cell cycle protein [Abditibacteriota bacterium]|nr:FtsW/RodA/SpoVE family cell cycle protein [Abditibacteriota bacterium]
MNSKARRTNGVLDALCIILPVFGFIMIFDTCALDRSAGGGALFGRAYKQIFFGVFSYALYYSAPRLWFYKRDIFMFMKRLTPLALGLSLGLMFAVTFSGTETNGAVRWLSICGFTLQPSELIKPVFCLGLAWAVTEQTNAPLHHAVMVYMMLFGLCGLVAVNNMSTGILYCLVLITALFVGGMSLKLFWGSVAGVCAGGFLFLMHGDAFRQMRIAAWLDPVGYAAQEGDQVLKSLASIASAGLFGCGFGNGHAKYIIPEPANDYIFTTIAEELGCAGCIVLILAYCLLMWIAWTIIARSKNRYCRILALTSASFILFQAFLNIAVTLNMLPSTGVCLPFVSYGGSSIIACFLLMTLLQTAFMHTDKDPKELKIYFKKRPAFSLTNAFAPEGARQRGGRRRYRGGLR